MPGEHKGYEPSQEQSKEKNPLEKLTRGERMELTRKLTDYYHQVLNNPEVMLEQSATADHKESNEPIDISTSYLAAKAWYHWVRNELLQIPRNEAMEVVDELDKKGW